jgi:hypothetical protein
MTFEERCARAIVHGGIVGIVLAALLAVTVFATGGTFGRRCERAFPSDAARQERCVYNLQHGVPA